MALWIATHHHTWTRTKTQYSWRRTRWKEGRKVAPLWPSLLEGSQSVQLTTALCLGSVVNIWALWTKPRERVRKQTGNRWCEWEKKEELAVEHLRAEDGDGVLGAEGHQAWGTPGNIVDDAVATSAYEGRFYGVRHGERMQPRVWEFIETLLATPTTIE